MEPSKEGRRTLEQTFVHWRSVGLIGACLAGGLTLTVMVIGSTPTIGGPIAAATEAVVAQAAAVDPSAAPLIDPATTEVTPDSTEVPVDPVQELLAAPALVETAPVSPGPAVPVAAPVAAPVIPTAVVPAPAQPTAQPASNPSPAAAPATPVPTPAPTTPPTAAPTTPPPTQPTTPPPTQPTTAPPTTPPPTTAAPPAAPALTYPSYTVSGVAGVTLQFDGSSISVASLSPQTNWVYEIAKNGPRSVEIKFFNVATGSDREFHATVEGGRIKVEN